MDAQRAMRIIRSNSNKWEINPEKIGVLGFSAGAMPCFIDALDHQEGSFFPLRTSRLNFTGGETVKHWRV